jgi:hypothetical protein
LGWDASVETETGDGRELNFDHASACASTIMLSQLAALGV